MFTTQFNPQNHEIIKLTVLDSNLFGQEPYPNCTDANQHEQLQRQQNNSGVLSFVLPFMVDLWAD